MDYEANTFHHYDGTPLPECISHEVHHLCAPHLLSQWRLTALNSCHTILQTASGSKTEIWANYLAATECIPSVESDWQPRKRGSIFSSGKKIVFTSKGPPSLLFTEYRQFFLKHKVAQAGAEAGQSRPYKAEVKNKWSYVSTLPYVFMPCRQTLLFIIVQFLCCWDFAVHSKAAEETLVDQVADGQINTHEEETSSEWFILRCWCLWMQQGGGEVSR